MQIAHRVNQKLTDVFGILKQLPGLVRFAGFIWQPRCVPQGNKETGVDLPRTMMPAPGSVDFMANI